MEIDIEHWRTQLLKPDWYIHLYDDFRQIESRLKSPDREKERKQLKETIYQLIEDGLAERTLPIAGSGPNMDAQRRSIDTIVIHHTKGRPGMNLERLNAIHCLRLYAQYYMSCKDRQDEDRKLHGQPLWSNHFNEARQVFYGYHWLIRQDGQKIRLLEDENIAWHCGCWHVNTRSLALAFDDNLHGGQPTPAALSAAAAITGNYSGVKPENIISHGEVRSRPELLSMAAWRNQFLEMLS